VVPTIHDEWIELSPSNREFVDLIDQTFSAGMSCIKSFVRWNKHRELFDYSEVLEDWDWEDTVGDDWDTPDSDYLDPESWIREDTTHVNKNKQVEHLLDQAYDKSSRFLQRFQPLLQIYWTNKQFDINILLMNLKSPVDSLRYTLELLGFYKDLFL
jgi:hypothetical protein